MKVQLASYNDCTGCGACKASCNKDAIRFCYDRNGFLRPTLDKDKCIECELCVKACPVLNKGKLLYNDPFKYACYTAWTKDDDLCRKCSSGGVSTQLMIEFLLCDNSVVYGAAMSDHNTCAHVKATNAEELERIIGTKYIQSDASWALKDAAMSLKAGERVLFSGTPCQIAALYSIVPDRWHNNLYTIELICHGTPSKLCSDYTARYYDCISVIAHRHKNTGWFINGQKHSSLPLMTKEGNVKIIEGKNFFNKCYSNFMNPSCFNCSYAKPERLADLTIGDQWGLAGLLPDRAYLGASSVIACSEKGQSLLRNSGLYLREDMMSTINAPNIFHPTWNVLGPWLARHAYISNHLSLKNAFAFLQLNHREIPLLILIKMIMRFGNLHNKKKNKEIINNIRKEYNWK